MDSTFQCYDCEVEEIFSDNLTINNSELSQNESPNLLVEFLYRLEFLVFLLLVGLGIFGNAATIWIVARQGLYTTTNIFLFSLAVSDLFFSATGIAKFGYSGNEDLYRQNTELFTHVGICYSMAVTFSYHLVALISVERLIAVSLPFYVVKLNTPRRITCIIIVLLMYVITINLLENNITSFYINKFLSNEDIHSIDGLAGGRTFQTVFNMYRQILIATVPLTVVILCTSLTVLKLQVSTKSMISYRTSVRKKVTEVKVVRMLLTVCVVFVVLVVPVTIYNANYCLTYNLSYETLLLSYLVNQLTASVNFIIYVSMSSRFSKAFRFLYCRHK